MWTQLVPIHLCCRLSPLSPQPHGSAAAAEGALQHAAARLPTALSPTASAPLARLENSTPDVAGGAHSPSLLRSARLPKNRRGAARALTERGPSIRAFHRIPLRVTLRNTAAGQVQGAMLPPTPCWEQTPETHALAEFLLSMSARMALTNAWIVSVCYRSRTGRTDMLSGRPAKKLRTAAAAETAALLGANA